MFHLEAGAAARNARETVAVLTIMWRAVIN